MAMLEKKYTGLAFGIVLFLGFVLRMAPAVLVGFPVNDGGMFFSMIRDLRSNGFFLPEATSYNFADIPFVYPPFGMYVAAILASWLSVSEFEILRWLPAIVTTGIIPTFYWLGRRVLNSKSKAFMATAIYTLMPGSSDWLVMGGGLTRSFGILFSLFALGSVYNLFHNDNQKMLMPATFFCALTVLSHPEAGLQTAAICSIFWVLYGRSRSGIKYALLVALGVALLTAAWWVTVLGYYGPAPFHSAIQTGIHETLIASLFHTFFSMQGALPILPVFGLIGIFAVLHRREVVLILWAFLPFFVDPRNAPAIAIFPLLMLASEGLYYLHAEFTRVYSTTIVRNQHTEKYSPIITQGSFACILLYLFLISCTVPSRLAAISLDASDRETMRWIRDNTPPESLFLLMTNAGNISPMTDSYQEWFPVLAERRSANTLQGMEWILGSNFFSYSQKLVALQACPDTDCLSAWLEQNNMKVDFILLQTEHANQSLTSSLRLDERYGTFYRSATAEVFAFPP
jgi:hypothetical protein